MQPARLTFLYPHLFRTIRVAEGAAASASRPSSCRRRATAEVRRRGYAAFAPTPGALQSGFAPRHGKGIEPVTREDGSVRKMAPAPDALETSPGQAAVGASKGDADDGLDPQGATATTATTAPPPPQATTPGEADEADEAKAAKQEARDQAKKSGPLEAILHMGPPEEVAKQHPHMAPPPYVHHFDSYSLVKDLEGGGYSKEQAITLMKAIRAILAQNLDVAQESLVSKSDVENETYLFRAACSELSTEVKNNQKLADEEMRQKRTLLQHEVDILTQSLNQELLTLNDNVRGMFNDRKMAVREEQKAGDSVIQQINYKISLHLSSDAKSEIEGLRWILIRRSVIGILFMAVLTLGTLRYGTYVSHAKQAEADKIRRQAEMLKMADGKRDHSSAPDAAEILAAN
ncbi:MOZ protein represents a chromatin-associated acetyltransferase [Colletotrichum tofieldiae]|uniref:MOZ protein represents a chromatin-associated acetyltransferase n=1 Tax=Colletotrichum tofieldiae TaxID=708197 RepID=A0A166TUN3_9PEZI|nr:MOZ protein represents a chromatin-associated acetyltransferase [Colletotrichum tofieldiae]GKT53700.1 MOZ protein represents a chromatin-associated acetyltransferase [Colletotrichum tofieldiae]GKT73443.1 MOZ protein represents a chromatin-associated acetyltransferase [Colletotrichum tofieldiae]